MVAWDDRKTWRARKAVQERLGQPRAEVGQWWRDEDGRKWRITEVARDRIYVTTTAPGPYSESIAVQYAWLTKWTRVA